MARHADGAVVVEIGMADAELGDADDVVDLGRDVGAAVVADLADTTVARKDRGLQPPSRWYT
jgi:hypothetical protein